MPVSETQYPLDSPNVFITDPTPDVVDTGAGSEEVHQRRARRDFSYLWGNAFTLRKRDIISGPASVGTCDNTTTTTTTGSATGIPTSNHTSTATGTPSGTPTGTGTTLLTVTTGTSSGTAKITSTGTIATTWADWDPTNPDATGTWGNWDPNKPAGTSLWGDWNALSTAWALWSSQSGSAPMTKTFCSGNDCRTSVVAIPTVTIYPLAVPDICETGLTTRTITITATCTKGCDSRPTGVPQGYTTTQVYCSACADPSTILLTVKVTETSSWSGWATDATVKVSSSAKPTTWSAIPAGSSATPAASVKSTAWSAASVATPAASSINTGSAWSSATSTNPMVAKYTGGATANAIAHTGVFVALAAAVLVL